MFADRLAIQATRLPSEHHPLPSPDIAPTHDVPAVPVRAALGRRAYAVWCVMCAVQNNLGETHYSGEQLASMARVTLPQYYRAIARLKTYRLITRQGWAWHEVNDAVLPARMMRFSQGVRGALINDETVRLPVDVMDLLIDKLGHGGKRSGAGRPSVQCFSRLNTRPAPPEPILELENNCRESLEKESKTRDFVREREEREKREYKNKNKDSQTRDAREGEVVFCGEKRTPEVAMSSSPAPDWLDCILDPTAKIKSEPIGTSIGGPYGPKQPAPVIPDGIVPPIYATGVKAIEYPHPLMPHAHLTPEQRAEMVALSYYGVMEHCYPGRDVRRAQNIGRSRHAPMLLAAAHALTEAMIYPSFWVMWSVAWWRKQEGNADKLPPMGWVFARARLDADTLRFCKETHGYFPVMCVYSPPYRELIRRCAGFEDERWRGHYADIAALRKLVLKWFPPGVYDDLVARAKRDNAELQQRLRDDQRGGKWLWS